MIKGVCVYAFECMVSRIKLYILFSFWLYVEWYTVDGHMKDTYIYPEEEKKNKKERKKNERIREINSEREPSTSRRAYVHRNK